MVFRQDGLPGGAINCLLIRNTIVIFHYIPNTVRDKKRHMHIDDQISECWFCGLGNFHFLAAVIRDLLSAVEKFRNRRH